MPGPLRNRVTPFGEIAALPERGLLTGNRGIIHDWTTRTIVRGWVGRRWIVCLCDFKGRRRTVMGRGSWTELFFLDEATAFAAGHRPCFECRRTDALAFSRAWAIGHGGPVPKAGEMDAILHTQRLAGRVQRRHTLAHPVSALPDGAMVAAGAQSYVVAAAQAWRWSAAGYALAAAPPEAAELLTPPATLAALKAGYRPLLHPSAGRHA